MWFWNDIVTERLMWHHNNNNSVNWQKGAIMKHLGVVAGVWDLEWLCPHGYTIWIDFKVGKDRLSEKQELFRTRTLERSRTALFFIVENIENFKEIIWRSL